MANFYIKTESAEDWKKGLADEKHWKTGYSAKTLAYAWEASDGFPDTIQKVFDNSKYQNFHKLRFLLGIPEYKVSLKGGSQGSQNDIFVLAKTKNDHLVSIAVEGKCNEEFGPLLSNWIKGASDGKKERIECIKNTLGIKKDIPGNIHYQLLHRSASAIIEAKKFNCKYAILLIHSFNQENLWLDDYCNFTKLFGEREKTKELQSLNTIDGIEFYGMGVTGDKKFLEK